MRALLLRGGVLLVEATGLVDLAALVSSLAHEARQIAHDALLLDLAGAELALRPRVRTVADAWRRLMPLRPCAIVRSTASLAFCRDLALQLATGVPAVLVDIFDEPELALEWCQARAATYRADARHSPRS